MKKHHKSLLGAALFFCIAFILDKPIGNAVPVTYESVNIRQKALVIILSAKDKVVIENTKLDQTTDTANIVLWQKQTRFSRRLAYSLDKEFNHYQFAIPNDN